jgi:hypothetical protein
VFALVALVACSSAPEPPRARYDVVVVGAGTGGSSAAIAAARHGAHVLLVEPTYWIGGQMASVPTLEDAVDLGPGLYDSAVRTGFVEELRAALDDHYRAIGLTISFVPGRYASEPNVVRDVLSAKLAEAGVTVTLNTSVTAVARDGATITGVTLSDGTIVTAPIVVDATETGDVLPLAGAQYRVGNQDSLADIDRAACMQSITYVAPIRKYRDGVPQQLVIAQPPPGYDAVAAKFATLVVTAGSSTTLPWNWAHHASYRAVPDSAGPPYVTGDETTITRTSVNLANDFPTEGLLAIDYLEDPEARRAYECDARLLSLQFLYYAQHELGETQWSVADDEGYDTDYDCPQIPHELDPIARLFPPQPYIRESRRIVAVETLTGTDVERDDPASGPNVHARAFHTAIARGWYSQDLHRCNELGTFELDTGDEATFPAQAYGPIQVPFESLIPVAVDGLLAAEKNIGVSRRANGTTRLEGVTLLTGEAVGVIAALAIRDGIAPRAVDPFEVQRTLVADGAGLAMDADTDVPQSHPRWAATQLALVRDVMRETAMYTFAPDAALTRADAAFSLARVFALPVDPGASSDFTDVAAGDPALPYIEAIFHAGVTTGCGAGLFCPTSPLTRAQLAVFLARGAGATLQPCTSAPYNDVATSDPACPAIAYAAGAGLVSGCNADTYCPTDPATRGDTAAALVATMIAHGAPP